MTIRAGLYDAVERFVQEDPCSFPSVGYVVDHALRRLMEDHDQRHRLDVARRIAADAINDAAAAKPPRKRDRDNR